MRKLYESIVNHKKTVIVAFVMAMIVSAVCSTMVNVNYDINDYLPDGYLALADSLETQSAADRAARKAPNIYLPIKLAGAIQSVVVSINVNR